jgi:hypothetical protein
MTEVNPDEIALLGQILQGGHTTLDFPTLGSDTDFQCLGRSTTSGISIQNDLRVLLTPDLMKTAKDFVRNKRAHTLLELCTVCFVWYV